MKKRLALEPRDSFGRLCVQLLSPSRVVLASCSFLLVFWFPIICQSTLYYLPYTLSVGHTRQLRVFQTNIGLHVFNTVLWVLYPLDCNGTE